MDDLRRVALSQQIDLGDPASLPDWSCTIQSDKPSSEGPDKIIQPGKLEDSERDFQAIQRKELNPEADSEPDHYMADHSESAHNP